MISLITDELKAEQASIIQRFILGSEAGIFLKNHSQLIDNVIIKLVDLCLETLRISDFAVIAVGGYGRREVFPYSDIDLLLLYRNNDDKTMKFMELFINNFWNLGLKLSQSVRNMDEVIKSCQDDVVFCTSLLDMYFVSGDKSLFKELEERFTIYIKQADAKKFTEAKLQERRERHLRAIDSSYVLEPNIKEGKGGLRDLHTIYWLCKYNYKIANYDDIYALGLIDKDELKAFRKAKDFLWQVRINLHLLARRTEERLTFPNKNP